MIIRLQKKLTPNTQLIFDFDHTIEKMEIDWSKWSTGVAKIYSQFNSAHDQIGGGNEHIKFNILAKIHGKPLIKQVQQFNDKYEKNTSEISLHIRS